MANTWNYAELSKAASAVGGPEKYIDIIVKSSKATGRKEMIPFVAVAAIGGAAVFAFKDKLAKIFRRDSANSQVEIEEAKKELIEGIKKYDEENQDNDEREVYD